MYRRVLIRFAAVAIAVLIGVASPTQRSVRSTLRAPISAAFNRVAGGAVDLLLEAEDDDKLKSLLAYQVVVTR